MSHRKIILGALYRHYRTRESYVALSFARRAGSGEEMILYRTISAAEDNPVLVRPTHEWFDGVMCPEKRVIISRFTEYIH